MVSDERIPHDHIPRSAALEIAEKDFIGIVEIGNDLLESREVARKRFGQLPPAREKRGERTVFNGCDRAGVEAVFRHGRDVAVTKQMNLRFRQLIPDQFDRGQRENEVSDRPSTNHQYPSGQEK